MKQKKRFKNFGNIGYWYRSQRSHIGRSLALTVPPEIVTTIPAEMARKWSYHHQPRC